MKSSFQPHDLLAILDGIDDGVVKLDGEANYLAMNKTAADTFRKLGQDPHAMIGKSVWELFPEVKGTLVERQLRQALEDDISSTFEFLHPSSQHWFETQAYPSSPGAILVFRDITDRKTASAQVDLGS
jgi:PAS domain S-box-containing protein